jgi:hypothetical protein
LTSSAEDWAAAGQQFAHAAALQHRHRHPRRIWLVAARLDKAFYFLCLHRPLYRLKISDP